MEGRKAAERWGPVVSAIGGAVCVGVMAARHMGLERGTTVDHLVAIFLSLALMALALFLLWREYRDRNILLWMLLPVAAAFLFRAMCMDYVSGDYQNFLSRWMEVFQQNGGFKAIALNIGDYNAPYLYFMAAISYTSFPDLYAYKLFSILFDVLLAWGSLRLTRLLRKGKPGDAADPAPAVAFAVALLLPTVILNSSYWGQCDSIYGALAVHAVALALEDRPKTSTALMAVAFSFKLQSIFVLPLWGVLWLGDKLKFRDLLVFPATYFATILPALLIGKPLKDILGVYFSQMGEYPRLTLNAPSVFQFIPYDTTVDDALFSALGITAAFALVLILLAVALLNRGRLEPETYFLMAVTLVIGVPFLLPRMHERYFFLADAITISWACWDRKNGGPVCLLAAGSSLASYLVYLRLQYNVIVTAWGFRFVMGVEALMMLVAFLLTLRALIPRLLRPRDGGTSAVKKIFQS